MKNWLCCFLICLPILTVSQQRKTDSLYQIIAGAKVDSNYMGALTLLAEQYRFSKPDSAIWYAAKVNKLGGIKGGARYIPQANNSMGYAYYVKGEYRRSIEAFEHYYRSASLLADKGNMAHAINNQGNVWIELGDYNKALQCYRAALEIRQQTMDRFGIAQSFTNLGFLYKDLGDYEKAISNFLFALEEFEKLGAQIQIAGIYNYLGIVYQRKNELQPAIDNHVKAYAIQQKLKDDDGMGISLQSLALAYTDLRQYDKAVEYYNRSIELYRLNNDKRQVALAFANLGDLYNRNRQYELARVSFDTAITINRQIGNQRNVASAWLGASVAAMETGRLPEAAALLDSAAKVVHFTNKRQDKKSYYQVKADYFFKAGIPDSALVAYKLYGQEKDSILNEENIRSMANMQVKYETEKKQLAIDLLSKSDSLKSLEILAQKLALEKNIFELTRRQLALAEASLTIARDSILLQSQSERILRQQMDSSQTADRLLGLRVQGQVQQLEIKNKQLTISRKNSTILVISILSVMAVLLTWMLYRRFQLKQQYKMELELAQQQEQAARSVLDAEEKERKRIAGDLHDGIGQMMSAAKMNLSALEDVIPFSNQEQRAVFEKAIRMVDESCREVRMVSHLMMPGVLEKYGLAAALRELSEKAAHPGLKINFHAEGLDNKVAPPVEIVLYRVVQEAVNNVLKHAGASMLDISLIGDEEGIAVTIEDNGKGFDPAELFSKTGIGMGNIKSRVEYLKGSLEIDAAPGKGTLLAIHIPISVNHE